MNLKFIWLKFTQLSEYCRWKWKCSYGIERTFWHNAQLPISIYSSAPLSTGNMFHDLPWLRETENDTERYILLDIRVTDINTLKFNLLKPTGYGMHQ
jgi:hypothetical protein